jgi:ribosomal protein L7Ae-like RNA K-turn-binding protein
MSRAPYVRQKQILRLDRHIELPESRVDNADALLSLVRTLYAEKSLALGINCVARRLAQGQVKLLLFASDINPPDLIQHLLQMAVHSKIPVVATGIDTKSLGSGVGVRSVAVLAVLAAARDDLVDVLRPFAEEVQQTPGLPTLRIESDLYVPRPKK